MPARESGTADAGATHRSEDTTTQGREAAPARASGSARKRAAAAGSPLQRSYGNRVVQRLLTRDLGSRRAPAADGDIQQIAAQGTLTGTTALPHASAIQASFGRHDIGHVSAHVGGAAAASAEAIGAEAYATCDHVVFRRAPDLRTAAHEAAHVVQQRAGVSLAGGVGAAGDAYERHADAVADQVVSGRSAEPLLSAFAAPAEPPLGGRAVQRRLLDARGEPCTTLNAVANHYDMKVSQISEWTALLTAALGADEYTVRLGDHASFPGLIDAVQRAAPRTEDRPRPPAPPSVPSPATPVPDSNPPVPPPANSSDRPLASTSSASDRSAANSDEKSAAPALRAFVHMSYDGWLARHQAPKTDLTLLEYWKHEVAPALEALAARIDELPAAVGEAEQGLRRDIEGELAHLISAAGDLATSVQRELDVARIARGINRVARMPIAENRSVVKGSASLFSQLSSAEDFDNRHKQAGKLRFWATQAAAVVGLLKIEAQAAASAKRTPSGASQGKRDIPIIDFMKAAGMLPAALRSLMLALYLEWQRGSWVDQRTSDEIDSRKLNSEIPGSLRSWHQNTEHQLPDITEVEVPANARAFHEYYARTSGTMNAQTQKGAATGGPIGYAEYTGNAIKDDVSACKIVLDYKSGLIYVTVTHYNAFNTPDDKGVKLVGSTESGDHNPWFCFDMANVPVREREWKATDAALRPASTALDAALVAGAAPPPAKLKPARAKAPARGKRRPTAGDDDKTPAAPWWRDVKKAAGGPVAARIEPFTRIEKLRQADPGLKGALAEQLAACMKAGDLVGANVILMANNLVWLDGQQDAEIAKLKKLGLDKYVGQLDSKDVNEKTHGDHLFNNLKGVLLNLEREVQLSLMSPALIELFDSLRRVAVRAPTSATGDANSVVFGDVVKMLRQVLTEAARRKADARQDLLRKGLHVFFAAAYDRTVAMRARGLPSLFLEGDAKELGHVESLWASFIGSAAIDELALLIDRQLAAQAGAEWKGEVEALTGRIAATRAERRARAASAAASSRSDPSSSSPPVHSPVRGDDERKHGALDGPPPDRRPIVNLLVTGSRNQYADKATSSACTAIAVEAISGIFARVRSGRAIDRAFIDGLLTSGGERWGAMYEAQRRFGEALYLPEAEAEAKARARRGAPPVAQSQPSPVSLSSVPSPSPSSLTPPSTGPAPSSMSLLPSSVSPLPPPVNLASVSPLPPSMNLAPPPMNLAPPKPAVLVDRDVKVPDVKLPEVKRPALDLDAKLAVSLQFESLLGEAIRLDVLEELAGSMTMEELVATLAAMLAAPQIPRVEVLDVRQRARQIAMHRGLIDRHFNPVDVPLGGLGLNQTSSRPVRATEVEGTLIRRLGLGHLDPELRIGVALVLGGATVSVTRVNDWLYLFESHGFAEIKPAFIDAFPLAGQAGLLAHVGRMVTTRVAAQGRVSVTTFVPADAVPRVAEAARGGLDNSDAKRMVVRRPPRRGGLVDRVLNLSNDVAYAVQNLLDRAPPELSDRLMEIDPQVRLRMMLSLQALPAEVKEALPALSPMHFVGLLGQLADNAHDGLRMVPSRDPPRLALVGSRGPPRLGLRDPPRLTLVDSRDPPTLELMDGSDEKAALIKPRPRRKTAPARCKSELGPIHRQPPPPPGSSGSAPAPARSGSSSSVVSSPARSTSTSDDKQPVSARKPGSKVDLRAGAEAMVKAGTVAQARSRMNPLLYRALRELAVDWRAPVDGDVKSPHPTISAIMGRLGRVMALFDAASRGTTEAARVFTCCGIDFFVDGEHNYLCVHEIVTATGGTKKDTKGRIVAKNPAKAVLTYRKGETKFSAKDARVALRAILVDAPLADADELCFFLAALLIESNRNRVAYVTNLILMAGSYDHKSEHMKKNIYQVMPMTGGGTDSKGTIDPDLEALGPAPRKVTDAELRIAWSVLAAKDEVRGLDDDTIICFYHLGFTGKSDEFVVAKLKLLLNAGIDAGLELRFPPMDD